MEALYGLRAELFGSKYIPQLNRDGRIEGHRVDKELFSRVYLCKVAHRRRLARTFVSWLFSYSHLLLLSSESTVVTPLQYSTCRRSNLCYYTVLPSR